MWCCNFPWSGSVKKKQICESSSMHVRGGIEQRIPTYHQTTLAEIRVPSRRSHGRWRWAGAAGIDIDEAEEQEDLGKKIKNGKGHRGVDEKKPGWEAKEPLAWPRNEGRGRGGRDPIKNTFGQSEWLDADSPASSDQAQSLSRTQKSTPASQCKLCQMPYVVMIMHKTKDHPLLHSWRST